MADFMNYFTNRLDNAVQPFNDFANQFGDETEEERRKRLAREEVQSHKIKTFADGSQQHTTTTQVPGASTTPTFNYPMVQPPANPMLGVDPANSGIYTDMQPGARVGTNGEEIVGPNGQTYNYNALKQAADEHMYVQNQNAQQQVPVQPVAPEQATVAQQQPPMAQPAPVPVPVQPATMQPPPVAQQPPPAPVAAPRAPAMAGPGQLHPEMQAKIDAVLPPATPNTPIAPGVGTTIPTSVSPQASLAQGESVVPELAGGPMTQANAGQLPAMTPTVQMAAPWQDKIATAKSADDFKSIMVDPSTPDEVRKLSAGRYAQDLKSQEEVKKAEKFIETAGPNDLIKAMRKNTEEGSYIKAILFSRLGLNDLAKEEQQKLGAGSVFQSLVGADGSRYTAEVNGQGAVTAAYDNTGKRVDDTTLAGLSAQGALTKGAQVHTSMLRDRTTGEIYYQRTLPNGSTQLVSPKGQVYAGNMANLYAYGIGSDIETKNQIQLQSLRNRLLNEPKIDAAKEIAKFNAINGTNYSVDQVISAPGALPMPAGAGGAVTFNAPAMTGTGQPIEGGAEIKNNNPGNIRYGAAAKDMGATGRAPNGMAIFPDLGTGTSAQEKLWSSPAYKNLTLGQAIAKWAPNNENNPAEYLRYMKRETSLDMDREFKDLSAEEKQRFLGAQARFEHGLPSAAGGGTTPTTGVNAPPTAIGATSLPYPKPIEGEPPAVYKDRLDAWKKENEKITGAQLAKVQNAKEVYDVFKEINAALPKATGSTIGSWVDSAYRMGGFTNEGMKATAELQVLGDRLLKAVPRFEGPQSDRDVQSYKDAAADLANPQKTIEERKAAFKTIVGLNKKYLPGVDWDMKNQPPESGIKIIKREKIS